MREFMIPFDGIALHAKLDFPGDREPEGKLPLVLLIHGFTGHMEERHIIAAKDTMTAAGYAVLRVEMYGHGGSEGAFREHTLFKWFGCAMAAFDYAESLDFVSDILLCGHSQGGLTVMMLAAMERERVKALIPLSPAWMIPEAARAGELLGVRFDPERVPQELGPFGEEARTLSGNYIRAAQQVFVEPAIREYTGPVLIIQGDADEAVPLRYARMAKDLYENAELVVVEGDTHCYDNHLDTVLNALRTFLEKQKG